MPKPSNISFGVSVKKRGTVAYTGENGKLGTCKIYFKQNKTTYPFQMQYRTRSRYNEVNEKKKNAKWTKWSDWKCARAFTSPTLGAVALKAKNAAKPVNKWLKANKGVNKKSAYIVAMNLTGHSIGSAYDGRQFELRIRTFSKSKAKHGAMAHQVLTVWKRTSITGERAFVGADGGLDVRYCWKGNDNGKLAVNSIKDASGLELLKPECLGTTYRWAFDPYYTGTLASGYTPARVDIPAGNLTRPIDYGEKLKCDIVYTNQFGAPTKLSLSSVTAQDTSLKEGIALSYQSNRSIGALVLNVTDSQAAYDSLASVSASIRYRDSAGIKRKLKPFASSVKLDGSTTSIAQFVFFPPHNTECTVTVLLKNNYGSSVKIEEPQTFKGSHYTLTRRWWGDDDIASLLAWINGEGDADASYPLAAAYSNVDFSVSTSATNIYLAPLGEDVCWGAAGAASPETTITFTADIVDTASEEPSCRKAPWETVRRKLDSTYILRTPQGDAYQVLIDKIQIQKSAARVFQVSLSAREVTEIV